MQSIIDIGSELIVDRSRVSDPYVRLLLAAMGQTLAKGSPWVAIDKRAAANYELEVPPAVNSRPEIAA